MCNQYGISALVSQMSFQGEASGAIAKCLLFSQAISLFIMISDNIIIMLIFPSTRHLRRMTFLLQTSDLSVRIAAGELLALMYEMGRNVNEDFGYRDRNGVCDLIRELATEGNKHIAKKDLRQQRSSFRDILKTIEVCNLYYASPPQRLSCIEPKIILWVYTRWLWKGDLWSYEIYHVLYVFVEHERYCFHLISLQ